MMKITMEPAALRDAAGWAARGLPAGHPATPILTGMKIAAADGQVTFGCFDWDLAATDRAAADVQAPGTVLVTGKLLTQITDALDKTKPVTLEEEGSHLVITSGRAVFRLALLPQEDYPDFPQLPDPAGRIGAVTAAAAISRVAVAAGRDDTLPALTAILLRFDGKTVMMAATDRYRLAVGDCPWEPEAPDEDPPDLLVPAKALTLIAGALPAVRDVAVHVMTGDDGRAVMAGFTFENRTLACRIIEGEFPRWDKLMPGEDKLTCTAVVNAADFMQAIKRAQLAAARNTGISIKFGGDRAEVTGHDAEVATATDEVAAASAEERTVTFNPHYLLDAISACRDGGDAATTVRLGFQAKVKDPVLVTLASDPEGAPHPYRHLVVPIVTAT